MSRTTLLVGALAVVAVGALGASLVPGAPADRSMTPDPVVVAVAPAAASVEEPTSPAGDGGADPAWVAETAARTGVPARAVQAYAGATLRTSVEHRGCRLGWTTLAGIGQVESGHGRGALGDDGRPVEPIFGPALDGSEGVAAIAATSASVAWHGDPRWDHAVGPLQFIPSTWAAWEVDADGDGVADPHDLDDAALAAARYLCHDGRDLSTADGWTAAIFSYNHADVYVRAVHAAATSYR
ncbi:lytic transglycosylase domain-containing protein [Aeromicrobium massiliense]|uniref:lytic transglycosylase domain-containing protein n=1 Tax=Aeromicrobium massiliense TaxID=1464554 RepID=UPI000578A605|nr:lytic transglycosylase domain-containing protein [Aeromicrobium massiliense]